MKQQKAYFQCLRQISFINQSYSYPMFLLKMLSSFIKLAHTIVISYICKQLTETTPRVCMHVIALELGFTIVGILITKKHRFDLLQIAISLFLTYTLIPNNYSFLAGLFFCKIIYVFNALGEAVDDLFSAPGNLLTRFWKIVLSILRYTLVEYLFLGLVLVGYKLWTIKDPEGQPPEDYLILYKLIVTATTIGYGDVTPKTKLQITYFTYTIPFICGSFVIYFNAVIPILGELIDFFSGNVSEISSQGCNTSSSTLSSKIWSVEERSNFVNFIDEVSRRQAEHEEHHKRLGHNWIALSANHYERQIPLLNSILRGDESKEVRLKVSSKVRRQYYPAGWTILQAGDVSEDLMMIDEGEVKVPSLQGKGYVFNKEGFSARIPARESVITTSFVAVWAISVKDLEELGRTSSRIKEMIDQGFRE